MFGLSIEAQAAANAGIGEAGPVGEDVDLRARVEVAGEAQELDQILAVEGRLAAGEADLGGVARQQSDQLESLRQQVVVDRRLRRLRAHQAVVIAALGEQDAVLAAVVAPEDADAQAVVADGDDVVAGEVVELGRQADRGAVDPIRVVVAADQIEVEALGSARRRGRPGTRAHARCASPLSGSTIRQTARGSGADNGPLVALPRSAINGRPRSGTTPASPGRLRSGRAAA